MNSNLTADQVKRIFAQYWNQRILMLTLHSDRLQLVDYFLYPRFSFDMKLALIPMDKATDDHKARIAVIYEDGITESATTEEKIQEGKLLINQINGYSGQRFNIKNICLVFQQLIEWGYAVPLQIEPGHPDNGKTAIELDIAIDKTLITFKN